MRFLVNTFSNILHDIDMKSSAKPPNKQRLPRKFRDQPAMANNNCLHRSRLPTANKKGVYRKGLFHFSQILSPPCTHSAQHSWLVDISIIFLQIFPIYQICKHWLNESSILTFNCMCMWGGGWECCAHAWPTKARRHHIPWELLLQVLVSYPT